jgi:hypothetical protein
MYNTKEAQFIEDYMERIDICSFKYGLKMDIETGEILKGDIWDQKITNYAIKCNFCHTHRHPNALKFHVKQHIKNDL